jgi:hypothetical protein
MAERRMEREIRRKAKEEAGLARSFRVNPVKPPRASRSPYEAWLDERDARRPLLREDLHSQSDTLAAGAVENGGGIDAVVEATGLRTVENVVRNIDPAILVRAYDQDAVARAFAPPDHAPLRRLSPDAALMQRRARGEPLRRLARDYGVSHTTLSRWFAQPSVGRQLRELQRRRPRKADQTAGQSERSRHASAVQCVFVEDAICASGSEHPRVRLRWDR